MTARSIQFTESHIRSDDILALWQSGKDTSEIANALWTSEHYIANRLPHILKHARQDQEWNVDRLQA